MQMEGHVIEATSVMINTLKKYVKIDQSQKSNEAIESKYLPTYYSIGECYISKLMRSWKVR